MTETLHDRLRARLEAVNLNPNEASVRAGLSRGYLQTVFNREHMGGGVQASAIAKLAPVLRTTVDYLVDGKGSPEIEKSTSELFDKSTVWNVAHALHQNGAAGYMDAARFANAAVLLCEMLTDDPSVDLASAIEMARRQYANAR